MAAVDPERLISTVDFRTIQRALSQIRAGQSGVSDDVEEAVGRLSEDPDRERVIGWVSELGSEATQDFQDAIFNAEKLHILEMLGTSKFQYIEETEARDVSELLEKLSLSTTYYYDSHFQFSNRSVRLYRLPEINGLLGDLVDEGSEENIQEEFETQVLQSDFISAQFAEALGDTPAPIIGDLEHFPQPRFLRFEDDEHLYLEFWSLGSSATVFDGNKGQSIEFNQRHRNSVRFHLDSGLVEIAGDKVDSKNHRTAVIQKVEELAISEEALSDGGEIDPSSYYSIDQNISEEDIWNVIENVGVISSVESFEGQSATVRFSSVDDKHVHNDDSWDDVKERPLRLANVKILLDDPLNDAEFIDPRFIDRAFEFDEDISIHEMKDRIEEGTEHDNIEHFTVGMNQDNDTVHIDKENCTPSTRRTLFDLVSDELGV